MYTGWAEGGKSCKICLENAKKIMGFLRGAREYGVLLRQEPNFPHQVIVMFLAYCLNTGFERKPPCRQQFVAPVLNGFSLNRFGDRQF